MRSLLLVGLGGALGAIARHSAGLLAVRWFGRGVPVATIFVNVLGSLLLGWLLAESHRLDVSPDAKLLLGTGLCGALTTFSTFSVESLRLVEKGDWRWVIAYLGGNLVLGFGAAYVGLRMGSSA